MRSYVAWASVILVASPPLPADAQTPTAPISGRVTADDGSAIAGAEISVAGLLASIRTDSAGHFVLERAPADPLQVQVRALGFVPLDTLIALGTGGARPSIVLRMARVVQRLDPVVTEASLPYGKPLRYQHTGRFDDFYERQARGRGAFFDRERIETLGGNTVMQLMSSVPGVFVNWRHDELPYIRVPRCEGTSIWGERGGNREEKVEARYRWLAVYIDGQRIGGGIYVLSQLNLADVETVEVYRGSSELPLIAMGDACAAVFITTRYTTGSILPKK